ncbi:2-(1,2-epoxy-1,2-dihydrophenyl)acetyl-CoA isomerase [Spirosomataceae bacterium TFI 002]|nr:2-(1,2-epoxy-1,2-dihydrophenyl)acetyl-CoA isomerase [Spirosomataceae bacterium TFI 002]
MNFETIHYNAEDGICQITLNRPKVFNALNKTLINEITTAITTAGNDEKVRVVIITGGGDKAFCSGADLKDGMSGEFRPLGETLRENYNPMILAMRGMRKPIICKMNGVAAGAGMSLALACDIIIADKNAYMSELFVGIGLMPDAGSMYFLPRIVGMQKTFELCSTGRKVYMEEALQLGLVSKAVPTEQLDDAVMQLANFYKTAPTQSIGWMKQVLNQTYNSSLEQVLELEAVAQTACGFTNDFGEGVMAFIQKREPDFKGK